MNPSLFLSATKIASLTLSLASILSLSGCATMAPALMGRTSYDVSFFDQVDNQITKFDMKIKAPSGVDLSSVTGMQYTWEGGEINVSNQNQLNTELQAIALTEINAKQTEALIQSLSVINALLKGSSSDGAEEESPIRRFLESRSKEAGSEPSQASSDSSP